MKKIALLVALCIFITITSYASEIKTSVKKDTNGKKIIIQTPQADIRVQKDAHGKKIIVHTPQVDLRIGQESQQQRHMRNNRRYVKPISNAEADAIFAPRLRTANEIFLSSKKDPILEKIAIDAANLGSYKYVAKAANGIFSNSTKDDILSQGAICLAEKYGMNEEVIMLASSMWSNIKKDDTLNQCAISLVKNFSKYEEAIELANSMWSDTKKDKTIEQCTILNETTIHDQSQNHPRDIRPPVVIRGEMPISDVEADALFKPRLKTANKISSLPNRDTLLVAIAADAAQLGSYKYVAKAAYAISSTYRKDSTLSECAISLVEKYSMHEQAIELVNSISDLPLRNFTFNQSVIYLIQNYGNEYNNAYIKRIVIHTPNGDIKIENTGSHNPQNIEPPIPAKTMPISDAEAKEIFEPRLKAANGISYFSKKDAALAALAIDAAMLGNYKYASKAANGISFFTKKDDTLNQCAICLVKKYQMHEEATKLANAISNFLQKDKTLTYIASN